MLRPSYSELITLLNEEQDIDNRITSRYTIVCAVSKRARDLIDGAEPLTTVDINKPISIAVKELSECKLKINILSRYDDIVAYNNENSYIEDKTMD